MRDIEATPLLSIVIATRNRIAYAISAIESIMEIKDARLELVVQDNSDSRELEDYVRDNIQDSRLRYRYTQPPFSMIDNFNAAIELATGEYVCMIGDDDGVNPEIIGAASWAKSIGLDALAVKLTVSYHWPGTGVPAKMFRKVVPGSLSVWDFAGSLTSADLEKELRSLVREGGVYYLTFDLPKLYHGLVHRRCLEAIHQRTGVYFKGLSPDIFSSLSIACIAARVVVTDYPLTIPGACPGSGSTHKENGSFAKPLEETFLWRGQREYRWCELVPRVYTAETVWVDSAVVALRAMGRQDLIGQLNLPKLAAFCIGANNGVTWPVLRALFAGTRIMSKNPAISAIQFAWSLLSGPGVQLVRRISNRFLILAGKRGVHRIDDLMNMVEASHGLTRYLTANGRSFANCASQYEKK